MGVKTPPLSSRIACPREDGGGDPSFLLSPKCHSEAPRGTSPPHAQRPSIPLLCAIPATQRAPLPPHGRPSWAPSPHPTHCRAPSYTFPLSFRGSARNLTGPRSTPLHPSTVRHSRHPTRSLFPHMAAPRGRPPPHPTHCRAPSYTSPVIPRLREEPHLPHAQRPSIPVLCAIPPPTALPLPHMGAPRGRPPPSRCPTPLPRHHPPGHPRVIPRHSGAEESRHPTLNTPPPIHLLDQPPLKKRLHKPVCVIRPFPHLPHIQPLQNLEAIRSLPHSAPSPLPESPHQALFQRPASEFARRLGFAGSACLRKP